MEKKKDTQKIYAAFAGKTKQELFELFHASANGLTEEQIERSRENYGENAISYGKKNTIHRRNIESIHHAIYISVDRIRNYFIHHGICIGSSWR